MKRSGFVFVETIVVISVLSLTLVMLFASYSYILRKSQERNVFDTTEMIYKTFYLKNGIDNLKPLDEPRSSIDYFLDTYSVSNGYMCKKMDKYNSYICDFNLNTGKLETFKIAFEIEKIYILTPKEIIKSQDKIEWLNLFDATTIDYILNLGEAKFNRLLIVKYKKTYGKADGTYEIFHSSMEV